ncbi:MAG: carbohydrate ABC transporter permease [Treponema sp.]|jgi:multiple sugar transport system permease protein/raffinose/stachyose/melibiose transport system permease protein|nr:carbohydrate ABC transporter permease [Treponema sp.]
MKTSKFDLLFNTVSYVYIVLLSLLLAYPVIYTIVGSFKTNMELVLGGSFLPKQFILDNYIEAFTKGGFTRYSLNSVIVSSAVTFLDTGTASMSGFAFSRYNFFGKKFFITLFVALMFVNLGSITMYPTYRVLHAAKLTGSLLGIIIGMVGGQTGNILLIMGFTKTIPREMDEAAIIDGCGMYKIYFLIILPMLRPILAVVALFAFRGAWNDYIWTLIMTISRPHLRTLSVAVAQLRYATNDAASWNLMVAGAAIAVIPILIVYAFAHNQFISGLTSGAVKG